MLKRFMRSPARSQITEMEDCVKQGDWVGAAGCYRRAIVKLHARPKDVVRSYAVNGLGDILVTQLSGPHDADLKLFKAIVEDSFGDAPHVRAAAAKYRGLMLFDHLDRVGAVRMYRICLEIARKATEAEREERVMTGPAVETAGTSECPHPCNSCPSRLRTHLTSSCSARRDFKPRHV